MNAIWVLSATTILACVCLGYALYIVYWLRIGVAVEGTVIGLLASAPGDFARQPIVSYTYNGVTKKLDLTFTSGEQDYPLGKIVTVIVNAKTGRAEHRTGLRNRLTWSVLAFVVLLTPIIVWAVR
jgi:hypothetical protein